MAAPEIQKQIIKNIEELLKVNITDTKIPPQGMDSEVFFAVDGSGNKYAIKRGRNVIGDVLAYKLLEENKIDIPVPKVFGVFSFEGKTVLVLKKINFPLLEFVPADRMHRYISSMVKNLKKIHRIKSDKAGFLAKLDKNSSWKEIMLSKFTGVNPTLDWKNIAAREGLDAKLVLQSVENIIKKIEKTSFLDNSYSLLHTDFNQRNLFVDPDSDEVSAIVDWGEAMFGDPIYDFARVRMLIWHFNLRNNALENYYKLLSFTEEQKKLEELYWISRIIEYMAYYSEELNAFNAGRIKLHQDFLREFNWKTRNWKNHYS